ncbi:MAG: sulfotransferase [Proteobacteria bacterium]|nr:sulfotransferase [Pseudomonadota bacterium]
MPDFSNYYGQFPQNGKDIPMERFPNNHVKYSSVLKPVEWIDAIYRAFNSQAFRLKKTLLKEFDSAGHLDHYVGTKEEINDIRDLIISFCDGFDNNPFLSPVGRFLLKKIVLNWLKNRKKVLQYYHANKTFIEANGKLKAPVIITGPPRSGTTLLHRLMSEDPNTRSPYTFEMEIPIPPLTSKANPLNDRRINSSSSAVTIMSRLARGFMENVQNPICGPQPRKKSL